MKLASWVLFLGVIRNYAWPLFDDQIQGMASKGLGAILVLGLMWSLWAREKSKPLALVMLWLAFEQLQIVVCSSLWIYEPWVVPSGMSICHAKSGLDTGMIGIFIISLIAWDLLSENNHGDTKITKR